MSDQTRQTPVQPPSQIPRPPHPSQRPVATEGNVCPACNKSRVALPDPDALHCVFEFAECWTAAGLQPPPPAVNDPQEMESYLAREVQQGHSR
jgi:hypothetical protein